MKKVTADTSDADADVVRTPKKKMKTWKKVLLIILSILLAAIICAGIYAIRVVNAFKNAISYNDHEAGQSMVAANEKAGIQVKYQIYTDEQIKENSTRAKTALYYFPAQNTDGKKSQFVVILSGGGYKDSNVYGEPGAEAAEFAKKGYTAFVLVYRTGDYAKSESLSPQKDLATAVKYIFANADKFNVTTKDYALLGNSAGGHVCSTMCLANNVGYKHFGIQKPAALLLAYPLLDVEHLSIEYQYLIAKGDKSVTPDDLSVTHHITSDYPPVYYFYGKNDVLFGNQHSGKRFAAALDACKVTYKYEVFDNAPHASGVGKGADSYGWVDTAMEFWQSQCS